ncbi:MAG: rhodanese-like domain-containing protein [Verrucomicrobia bacterium]|nr:rhodanese-like domain-containing protein [Verrucomicrobiota bacterium]MDA1067792.1 rhodanese-like domain-containing protein [Verrucomicrobiota bacterium]
MNKVLRESVILLLLSSVGMAGTWLLHPDPPPWNPMVIGEGEISLNDALALENKTWIDARGDQAFEEAHIPDAILLNEDHWNELFETFIISWDGVSTLVVYCDSRTCAASHGVAERLKASLGTEDIFVLKGGWQSWLEHLN